MSNPTSNFNWQMPTATDLVTDLPADFEVFGQAVDTSLADLRGGTTGQILAKNTNTDMDFVWTSSVAPFSPNLAINGAFIVNQRNYVSGANLASGAYGFDRWKSNYTNTTLTYTAGVNSTPVTISTSGGIQQIVERQNVPAGTYTLSWSGTATGRVYNSGGTPPSYAASPVSFTADGLANVVVEFTASGSSKTLSLVKFERGSTATTYSLAGNTFEGELSACQRYYYRINADSLASAPHYGLGFAISTTSIYANVPLATTMRIIPNAIDFSVTNAWQGDTTLTGSSAFIASDRSTTNNGVIGITVTGATQFRPYFLVGSATSSYLGFSAEL